MDWINADVAVPKKSGKYLTIRKFLNSDSTDYYSYEPDVSYYSSTYGAFVNVACPEGVHCEGVTELINVHYWMPIPKFPDDLAK